MNQYVYYAYPYYDDELVGLRYDKAKEYEKLGTIIKVQYSTRMRFTQAHTPRDSRIAAYRMRKIIKKVRAML